MSEKTPGAAGKKNIILNVLIVVCVAVILFCGIKIVHSLIEYKRAEEKYGELEHIGSLIDNVTTTTTITTSDTTGESESTSETTAPAAPVPKDEYKAIYEQLSSMKTQYPDLFGWIYIKFDEEHIINLPVMQSEDNQYYIDHAYDGTESSSGAIFIDYRNTDRKIDLNQNMIFYGHNMNNSSMFALISTQYKKQEYFNDIPITFYSLEGAYTFNVFSIYNSKAEDGYDTVAFRKENLKAFCEDKQIRSFYSKHLTFTGDETVATLVTCTNYVSDNRVIVHGVLDGYDSFFS